MSDSWPGRWHTKEKSDLPAGEKTGPSYTNDGGTRLLVGDTGEAYIWMGGDIPDNTC